MTRKLIVQVTQGVVRSTGRELKCRLLGPSPGLRGLTSWTRDLETFILTNVPDARGPPGSESPGAGRGFGRVEWGLFISRGPLSGVTRGLLRCGPGVGRG